MHTTGSSHRDTMMDECACVIADMLDVLDPPMHDGHAALMHVLASTAPAQNTDEWLRWRNHRLTASDAAKIMGKAVKSQDRLVREKWGFDTPWGGNEFTKAGHDHEGDAVAAYEALKNVTVLTDLRPVNHSEHPQLGASLDGITTGGVNVEVKCLQDAAKRYAKPKPMHAYQAQFQMACSGARTTHLIYYYLKQGCAMDIFEIDYDAAWWSEHAPKFLAFCERLPPERAPATYIVC
jgi:putative phage-type endonuclease